MRDAFIGYPSGPPELIDNISAGIAAFRDWRRSTQLCPWTEIDGASTPIIDDVLRMIRETEASIFDITVPNPNVFYEIGYAVGAGKPIFLTLLEAWKGGMERQIQLGMFDTQRLKRYRNGGDLANIIRDAREPYQQSPPGITVDQTQPIYFQHHAEKIEFATSYFAAVKALKLGLRTYDPSEDHRLPLDRAFREINSSAGVYLSLIPSTIKGAEEHNLRAYLLAGIADGAGVPRSILKYQDFTAPFDLRDGVTTVQDRDEIKLAVLDLIPRIHERQAQMHVPARPLARSHIMNLSLGATAAENERLVLDNYFLETREFKRTLRGEARLVVGRKGVGKTAIFWQVRNRIRANRANLVLDLRPEGFQLRKLSEVIATSFSEATHAHTMTIFWEYVLYLELAHKILDDDRAIYARDSRLTTAFEKLRDAYENIDEFREGDFPERLLRLINRLRQELDRLGSSSNGKILTTPELTELIYRTDFPKLRDIIIDYVALKKQTLILIDNLDRGWTTAGVTASDVRIVQCLMDAGRRIERAAGKSNVQVSTVIFLRDDVYHWLLDEASDRGKDSTIWVQWREPVLLHQLVDARLQSASVDLGIDPPLKWTDIATGDIDNEPIIDYLIRHCLRRPRSLLDMIELCLSNASLAGRSKISEDDAKRAVSAYSTDMLRDLNFEIRDVAPDADRIIYSFANESVRLDKRNVVRIAKRQLKDDASSERFVRMMLWFGFFGVLGADGEESYVFDHGDDVQLLLSHAGKSENPILCIHPLFRSALSIRTDLLF